MTERNAAIHREARASLPTGERPTFERAVLQENAGFASVREGAARSTIELLQIERGRDMPRSRLADALAESARDA